MIRVDDKTSLWWKTSSTGLRAPLDRDLVVDVVVVGGGITGVTAALLLKEQGKSVALVEAHHVGAGVTGGTTGHLSQALDARYVHIASDFGRDAGVMVASATRAALDLIDGLVQRYAIDCGYEKTKGYLYAESADGIRELHEELMAARGAGLSVAFVENVPLPFKTAGGVVFENQAQIHSLRYIFALAERLVGDGCYVFESTRVFNVEEGQPCQVQTESGHTISCQDVLFATHAALQSPTMHNKNAYYRSYAIAVPMANAPVGLFWDTADPYHYIRHHDADGTSYLVVGGEDHKTGQEPEASTGYRLLQEFCTERFGQLGKFTHAWSSQIAEPVDGLPYIGPSPGHDRLHVATGFSGDGLTLGTLAGILFADAIKGHRTAWHELFKPERIKPIASAVNFLRENIDFPLHMVTDRFRRREITSFREIESGDGEVVTCQGRPVAAYRNAEGHLQTVSPICTHLGCDVAFNNAEKSWDCPCHGSRFSTNGEVITGPAVKPLQRLEFRDEP